MMPDTKSQEAIAADRQRVSERDIIWHTIPQGVVVRGFDPASGPDMTVSSCARCGTATTRAGLCSNCANPIECTACGYHLDKTTGICLHCGSPICHRYEREGR